MKILRQISILCLVASLVLGLTFAAPANAATAGGYGQKWFLCDDYKLIKAPVTGGGSDEIEVNETKYWVTDVPAQADVTFSPGTWTLVLSYSSFFECEAGIGGWDGQAFYGPDAWIAMSFDWVNETFTLEITTDDSFTIKKGDYLAISLTNRLGNTFIIRYPDTYTLKQSNHGIANINIARDALRWISQIFSDTDSKNNVDSIPVQVKPSYLTSPANDPGYPLPELAAGILFSLGIAGLATSLLVNRRRKSLLKV